MDVEFKPMTLSQAASTKGVALVLAIPVDRANTAPPSEGAAMGHLLKWVRQVLDSGNLEAGVDKFILSHMSTPVSYTHLDVYKRQVNEGW